MNDWRKFTAWALLACTASLTFAGCGGGGNDDAPQPADNNSAHPPDRFAAEGFWGGQVASAGQTPAPWSNSLSDFWSVLPPLNASGMPSGTNVGLVVLPAGETWGVYIASNGIVQGAMHGQAQVTGSKVIIPSHFFGSLGVSSVNYSGNVTSLSQIYLRADNSVIGNSYGSLNLMAAYDPHYDQSASLLQIAGTHTGTAITYAATSAKQNTSSGGGPVLSLLGNNTSFAISSAGAVTLSSSVAGSCNGTGTVTPRTGKSVFDLRIEFSGTGCGVIGTGAFSGIAAAENGHLLMLAVPPGTPSAGEFVFVSQ